MRTMQTLLNMVDLGMNIQQAIEAPRWSTQSFPASPFPHTIRFPDWIQAENRIAICGDTVLCGIHPPETICKVLECLGLHSRAPPISSQYRHAWQTRMTFIEQRKPNPLLPRDLCEYSRSRKTVSV